MGDICLKFNKKKKNEIIKNSAYGIFPACIHFCFVTKIIEHQTNTEIILYKNRKKKKEKELF